MSVVADTAVPTLPLAARAQTPDALLIALLEQQRLIDQQLEAERENTRLLEHKTQIIERKTQIISNLEVRVRILEEQLRLEQHRRFGKSSETNVLQTALDLDDDTPALADGDADPDEPRIDEPTNAAAPRSPRGKKGLSPELPRVRREFLLSDAEREGAIQTFFTKVKEELDIVPAQVQVIEYWQEKAVYLDEDGERGIRAAARPPHPIGKGIASVNLLAWLVITKVVDGMPLNRLANILARYGGEIDRSTLAQWLIQLHVPMAPLIQRLETHLMASDYVQGDETRLQVLNEPGTEATGTKWIWVMRGGPPDRSVVMFNYDKSRGGAVAERLLGDFTGRYFQSDGYPGYDAACRVKKVVHLGCFDHARRKVVEAIKTQPKPASGKPSKAMVLLSKIDALYRLEREWKTLDDDERYEQRQKRAVPKLTALKRWLDVNAPKVAKDSLTRKAMNYAVNQWEHLVRYCEHGQLRISNVLAENAIRPFAVGRKGWLFASSPEGAKALATFFTLIESAKANGVDPYVYMQKVIGNIATADTDEALDALLPWNMT